MLEKKEVYYCETCENIVESLWNGKPAVQCCGKPMEKLDANTTEAATEKHIPVISREGNKVTVSVGSTLHPMQSDHYILFVELMAGNDVYRHDFVEGDTNPVATFMVEEGVELKARAFCNLHSFWASA